MCLHQSLLAWILNAVIRCRFGILPSCNHVFCLECIRAWRTNSETYGSDAVRVCPICRVESCDIFIIPTPVTFTRSDFWPAEQSSVCCADESGGFPRYIVVPCERFVDEPDRKAMVIEQYKQTLKRIP
eukprot:COSAG01_NODE_153_length_23909_cov_32.542018_7_plen_128_part_00